VAVADAYDAMVTDRPYKRAISHEHAIAELQRHAGTQFDPELVEYFCDLYMYQAPVPDPGVLAMIAKNTVDRGGPAIMVPDAVPGRAIRRRRTDEVPAANVRPASATLAADGALDVSADVAKPRPTRRQAESATGPSPVTTLPAGTTRTGRSETATS
jgi:hypothetical protein